MRGVPILVAHGSARGAHCSAMLLKMSSPVLNHRMLGAGSGRQSAISMRMTYGGQRQRKHEPTTARSTPNPSFAAGSCDALVPRNSPAKPSSRQGFANSRWRDSHQTGGDDSRKETDRRACDRHLHRVVPTRRHSSPAGLTIPIR